MLGAWDLTRGVLKNCGSAEYICDGRSSNPLKKERGMWRDEHCLTTFVWILLASVFLGRAAAEDVPAKQLLEMAAAAKGDFQPVTADDLDRLKSEVFAATQGLDNFLAHGTAQKREGWYKYLKLDAMREELAKDKPDLRSLQGFRERYFELYDGLELDEFREVRDALTLYMNALLASSQPKLDEMYQARLDDLAKHLQALQEEPSSTEAIAIGRTLGWLEQAGQAEELVAAVRNRYRQPNLLAQLSEKVMTAGFAEEIHEVQPVRDNILGTSIQGTARMHGEIGMRLVPDPDRAALDILLSGRARSTNVGYNGPVTVYSTGNTSINASKRVYIDREGFRALGAVARCGTSSHISRIAAECCLVEKIAWKRARRTKSQAERIASSRAAGRVQRRFDGTAGGMLAEANDSFTNKFADPLVRRDSFPNTLNFRSTDQHLLVELMRAGTYQLAAIDEPPALSAEHDVAIRLHESLVGNFSETLIGGETLTDEKLIELLEQAEMEVPPELQIGPDKDPWSITFSRDQPISASFSADGVRVAIKGREFSRGEQVIRATIEISAVYQLEKTADGAKITRQGDVEVEYVNRRSLSVPQIAMKTFLRRKFDSLFEKDLSGEGLQLPGRWERAGKLLVQQLESGNGWLTVGWAHLSAAEIAEDEAQPESDQVAAAETH
jgi:hypothetical protein